jgi:hypothetical protein
MSKESTTLDRVELTARLREAANRRDVDSMVSFFTPDAVVGYADRDEAVKAVGLEK